MRDKDKTKEQLITELVSLRELLRQCVADVQARNQDLDDVARYLVSEFRSPLGMIVGFAELLEEEHATLSVEEVHHCIRALKHSGRKMGEMVNVLLLLANSRRLFDNVWYVAYLAAMGETSLSQWAEGENVPEAYRFTCLPASSAPMLVQVWAAGGETLRFHMLVKYGSGRGDDEGEGSPASQETQRMLASEEWDSLLAAVQASEFWTDASSLEELGWLRMVGTGGEEWVFEGWRDGECKARAVWNPDDEKARAAYALGRSFVNLLPGWFALELARFWAADSWPKNDQRYLEGVDLGAALGSQPDEDI